MPVLNLLALIKEYGFDTIFRKIPSKKSIYHYSLKFLKINSSENDFSRNDCRSILNAILYLKSTLMINEGKLFDFLRIGASQWVSLKKEELTLDTSSVNLIEMLIESPRLIHFLSIILKNEQEQKIRKVVKIPKASNKRKKVPYSILKIPPIYKFEPKDIKFIQESLGFNTRLFSRFLNLSIESVRCWKEGLQYPTRVTSRLLSLLIHWDYKFIREIIKNEHYFLNEMNPSKVLEVQSSQKLSWTNFGKLLNLGPSCMTDMLKGKRSLERTAVRLIFLINKYGYDRLYFKEISNKKNTIISRMTEIKISSQEQIRIEV